MYIYIYIYIYVYICIYKIYLYVCNVCICKQIRSTSVVTDEVPNPKLALSEG